MKIGPQFDRPKNDPIAKIKVEGDPAEGRKVPRCRICGLPDQPRNHLRLGRWTGLGPLGPTTFSLGLCDRCILSESPRDPMAADPLYVEDDAA